MRPPQAQVSRVTMTVRELPASPGPASALGCGFQLVSAVTAGCSRQEQGYK